MPKFLILCLAIAALVGPILSVYSQPPQPERREGILPFQTTETTLPNGLKVIVVPTGFPNIVSLQIPVQAGSRNEIEPGKSGFAHFFEHMMFRGTETYPPAVYNAILTKAGARQNAYTTDDYTNYHVTFAKEDLETILKIEADRFQNLSYSEADFKTESRAILGEYNKNSADPVSKLFETQRDSAFTTHTYKHTTMGFLRDIEDMPNQFTYSREFFARWYRPEYTTLIVAGDVKADEVLPLVERYWGEWKRGDYRAQVPAEPAPQGAVYAHVPWETPTLPWVAVAFHGPPFSDREKDFAAMDMLLDLYFGPTSDLYRRLVEQEQKADRLFPYLPATVDPQLVTVGARLKKAEDAVEVRNRILQAFAEARMNPPSLERLENAKSNARYSLIRGLDNTDQIAATLARYVRFSRSYDTLNNLFGVYERLETGDLQKTAQKYFTDKRLVVTTLSREPLPETVAKLPALASFGPKSVAEPQYKTVLARSSFPQLTVKFAFDAGAAYDPPDKKGLAAMTAAMVFNAGSKDRSIDEIRKRLYPMAGAFDGQVDRELSTFTASIHKDNWRAFLELVIPMLLDPGFRQEDFDRIKDAQLNALRQDLRASNEEELGKERLQTNLFRGSAYGHPVVGTIEGINSITLDDVKQFWKAGFAQSNLILGLAGDVPEELTHTLEQELSKLPLRSGLKIPTPVSAHRPEGMEVEIIRKETRATAISFGHPIEVTRSHPDFAALSVAQSWLGEHRSSMARLFQRIREVRGMNYGDYAYIEGFPRGMFQFVPDSNLVRRQQIFEIWIRPVVPEHAPMAIRIALHELNKLIQNGLSPEEFETTRDYLMKNVFLLTSTQDLQIGYAVDSEWYGTGEFTKTMRESLAKLTVEDVNRAVRKHLSARNLSFVIITKDADDLKNKLLTEEAPAIKYEAAKPQELLDEDKTISAIRLNIAPEKIRITPVEEVFSR